MILRKFRFDFQQLLLYGLHFRAPRFTNAESHNIINLLEWRDVWAVEKEGMSHQRMSRDGLRTCQSC